MNVADEEDFLELVVASNAVARWREKWERYFDSAERCVIKKLYGKINRFL